MIEWLILTAKIAAVWLAASIVFGLVAGRLMPGASEPEKKGDADGRGRPDVHHP